MFKWLNDKFLGFLINFLKMHVLKINLKTNILSFNYNCPFYLKWIFLPRQSTSLKIDYFEIIESILDYVPDLLVDTVHCFSYQVYKIYPWKNHS
jgi:hypothetical protein